MGIGKPFGRIGSFGTILQRLLNDRFLDLRAPKGPILSWQKESRREHAGFLDITSRSDGIRTLDNDFSGLNLYPNSQQLRDKVSAQMSLTSLSIFVIGRVSPFGIKTSMRSTT